MKFQIDSSEYVQPKIDESVMRSYTDYEKAKQNEYKLNLFSTVSSFLSTGTSPGQTDDEHESSKTSHDESITIKTAQTKNDWIQEWAKNARRCTPKLQNDSKSAYNSTRITPKDCNQITHSYSSYDQFGYCLINDNIDEKTLYKTDQPQNWGDAENSLPTRRRPPISPTKIPSPMNTQIRLRSSSAKRSFRHSNIVSVPNYTYSGTKQKKIYQRKKFSKLS